eukprot:5685764-Heterocapsa_arctica.AAC.1
MRQIPAHCQTCLCCKQRNLRGDAKTLGVFLLHPHPGSWRRQVNMHFNGQDGTTKLFARWLRSCKLLPPP